MGMVRVFKKYTVGGKPQVVSYLESIMKPSILNLVIADGRINQTGIEDFFDRVLEDQDAHLEQHKGLTGIAYTEAYRVRDISTMKSFLNIEEIWVDTNWCNLDHMCYTEAVVSGNGCSQRIILCVNRELIPENMDIFKQYLEAFGNGKCIEFPTLSFENWIERITSLSGFMTGNISIGVD